MRVTLNVLPGPTSPESQAPTSEVVVWVMASWFVHVTVPPAKIATVAGLNTLPICIVTAVETAG